MRIQIPEAEFEWRFATSGGPGGQHANRSNTRAELTFDVETSTAIPAEVKPRVVERLGSVVRVVEDGSRSQRRNRAVAAKRLHAMVEAAIAPDPPRRRATKPTRSAKEKRLTSKRRRSRVKERRRPPSHDD